MWTNGIAVGENRLWSLYFADNKVILAKGESDVEYTLSCNILKT